MSYRQTDPSERPTASRFGCVCEKASDITPERHSITCSGKSGFLRDHNMMAPVFVAAFEKSVSPYATASTCRCNSCSLHATAATFRPFEISHSKLQTRVEQVLSSVHVLHHHALHHLKLLREGFLRSARERQRSTRRHDSCHRHAIGIQRHGVWTHRALVCRHRTARHHRCGATFVRCH